MNEKTFLSEGDIDFICTGTIGHQINKEFGSAIVKCFAIPRGGVPALERLMRNVPGLVRVKDPKDADVFIDDIIDSGATREKWTGGYPLRPFLALVDKTDPASQFQNSWIVFPWEGTPEAGIADNITRVLQYIGEDVGREGLSETPARVAKALSQWFSGYGTKPEDVLKVFEDGAENYDQMVVVKDIPIYSKCEHHMADIFGTVTIAYIPDGKIVGLSKLSRLADMYARRLQVQERLTNQIASALYKHLEPKGVGVILKARHMCMESRGICQQGHYTMTTALKGAFLEEAATRAEFMALAR